MSVRAALDFAPQHARHHHIGAEVGAAGDLVDPVRADRTGPDDLPQLLRHIGHANLPPVLSLDAVIASEAKQSRARSIPDRDCFVASLLAMTPTLPLRASAPLRRARPAAAAGTSASRADGCRWHRQSRWRLPPSAG